MTKQSYDVVVIGSGIGGLCAAARLAHAGYKTLVLERLPYLGGRYTFVDYNGFFVPTGAFTIFYGEKDPVLQTLRDVSAKTNFEMRGIAGGRFRIKGRDYDLPPRGALWHLMSLVSRDKAEEAKVIAALRRALKWNEPSDSVTFSEWLLEQTDNVDIWKIMQLWCAQMVGMNLYEVPAGEMIRCLRNQAGTQVLIPRNGLKDIVDSLVQVITSNNGEILTSMECQRIRVKEGVVTGVEAKGSAGPIEIKAKAVISDVGPKKTVELSGDSNFSRGYLKDVRERLRPVQGLEFILSSNGSLYNCPGGLNTIDTRRCELWIDYTLTWPEFAPKGKNWMLCYVVPQSIALYNPKEEYDLFLADLVETFPDFKDKGGEILLARQYSADWPVTRSWIGYSLPQKTPVENLYNVGDGVMPSGWMFGSACAESARIVVEDITRKASRA